MVFIGRLTNQGRPGPDHEKLADAYPKFSFILPKLSYSWSIHQTLMMILFFQTGDARLVIHTANLEKAQWKRKVQAAWISPLLKEKPVWL
jgi:hypothetical protein